MLNPKWGGRQRNFATLQAVEMTGPWKSGNPKPQGFPLSHRPDGLRRKEGEGRHRTGTAPRFPQSRRGAKRRSGQESDET